MTASQEIESIQNTVITLLKEDEKYRDSVKKLSCKIWSMQLGGNVSLKKLTAYDFFCYYVDEKTKLVSHESIGRASRKAQEDFPELRGKNYKHRIEEVEKVQEVVRKNLNS